MAATTIRSVLRRGAGRTYASAAPSAGIAISARSTMESSVAKLGEPRRGDRVELAVDVKHDDSHDEHGDEDVEEDADLDEEWHALRLREPKQENPVLEHQVA